MDQDIDTLQAEELSTLGASLLMRLEQEQAAGADTTEVEGLLYQIMEREKALAEEAAQARQDRLTRMGLTLKGELDKRRGERQQVELRWMADTRRYNGEYEADKALEMAARKFGSKSFVPITRRVINVLEARLGDLLFPADDLNFGVEHSPVPTLGKAAQLVSRMPDDQQIEVDGEQIPVTAVKQAVGEMLDQARTAAAAMQREVEDQLAESDYPTEARRAIRDGLVLGLGVIKGPTLYLRTKKQWTDQGDGRMALSIVEDTRPSSARVDPWLFFPETAAKSMKDCGSVFEGHPMSATEFAALAQQPGFDKDAIRDELRAPPGHTPDANERSTQEAAGVASVVVQKHMVWEYHGPIEKDDLEACGCELPDDPLMIYSGVVFFTDRGRVLKAIINPMATGALPYHTWSWLPDQNSIFGFGLSYELADMQDAANSSWRASQDNMGLSVGGQLVVDTQAIQPQDNQWAITPNKVWRKTQPGGRVEDYFKLFEIPSRVNELLTIFNVAKQLCDEIGGPMLAMQGQDAPSYMQTAQGMGIAYNAASVWMRRGIKNWDDFITIPQITQYVDWNMEHNPKADIKGDMRPVARGSSHLLEAEGQVQRIQILMQSAQAMGIPIRKAVNQLRAMARAMRLDERELLPDDTEIAKMEEAQAQQQPQLSPEQERLQIRQMELQDRQADREHQAQLTAQTNQIRMAELAQKEGLSVADTRAKYELESVKVQANLQDRREQRAHDAQALNAEIATRMQTGAGV